MEIKPFNTFKNAICDRTVEGLVARNFTTGFTTPALVVGGEKV